MAGKGACFKAVTLSQVLLLGITMAPLTQKQNVYLQRLSFSSGDWFWFLSMVLTKKAIFLGAKIIGPDEHN